MEFEKVDLRWHYYWMGACIISEFQAGFISNKCMFCSIGEVASSLRQIKNLLKQWKRFFWFSFRTKLRWERKYCSQDDSDSINGRDRTTMECIYVGFSCRKVSV